MRRSRLAVYLIALAVFFGGFFVTLWLTESDNRSSAERLAAHPISDSSDLEKSAQSAELTLSPQLLGYADTIRRVDEQNVMAIGWAADREGDSTPLEVLVFVARPLVATAQTEGERPDVTAAVHLEHGAEKNVAFALSFPCRTFDQPIVVVIGRERQYLPMPSGRCP
jgi:hypothetical protein